MVTISDVAKLAHVSKMTVSRVINHPEQVSDDLKKLVYDAMEKLNYVPNYAARALVSNRTQVIKFLILEEYGYNRTLLHELIGRNCQRIRQELL